ncbi:MAG: 30S ribosomal protein S13 [Nitrosopumilaceae archaeon]
MTANEYQHIVRIVGNDIPGAKKIIAGLAQIKGIGYNFANAIIDSLKIHSNGNIGNLTESQVQSIEKIIKDPNSANFPSWFFNRRKDVETGQTIHMITSDIALTVRNDIEREKGVYSWRGYRHMYGLKVRGQCTRTSGRKGGAVGVQKGGKVLPAGAPGAPGAEAAVPAEGTAPAEGAATGKGTAPATGKGTAPATGKGTAPAAGKETPKETKGGAKK